MRRAECILLSFRRVSLFYILVSNELFFQEQLQYSSSGRCKRDELALVCDENTKRLHVSYGRQSGAVNKERKLGEGGIRRKKKSIEMIAKFSSKVGYYGFLSLVILISGLQIFHNTRRQPRINQR